MTNDQVLLMGILLALAAWGVHRLRAWRQVFLAATACAIAWLAYQAGFWPSAIGAIVAWTLHAMLLKIYAWRAARLRRLIEKTTGDLASVQCRTLGFTQLERDAIRLQTEIRTQSLLKEFP